MNFIYVHLNRVIRQYDLNVIYVTGPGHGGPGLVANAYLEGTYSELYPNVSQDEQGMKKLFTIRPCWARIGQEELDQLFGDMATRRISSAETMPTMSIS